MIVTLSEHIAYTITKHKQLAALLQSTYQKPLHAVVGIDPVTYSWKQTAPAVVLLPQGEGESTGRATFGAKEFRSIDTMASLLVFGVIDETYTEDGLGVQVSRGLRILEAAWGHMRADILPSVMRSQHGIYTYEIAETQYSVEKFPLITAGGIISITKHNPVGG